MMQSLNVLGDPHLGRIFLSGVPLHRRGEREETVWRDFARSLQYPGDVHVCIGDLFDKSFVPYNVIMRAANLYLMSANSNPNTEFYVIKGNHDWMRDLTSISAFDVFRELVAHKSNIHVVTDVLVTGDKKLFIAWHPIRDIRSTLKDMRKGVDTAFTHCDVMDLADGNINLIPTKELFDIGIRTAYNGHIHKPRTFDRDGVNVIGTGSMQPYAHGEEVNDDLYVTTTLDKLASINTHNKCVRVVLHSGETLDHDVDCLQLVVKRLSDSSDVMADIDLGDFDTENVFTQSLKDAGVSTAISERLLDEYNRQRLSNGV